jgi:hypothetical protein
VKLAISYVLVLVQQTGLLKGLFYTDQATMHFEPPLFPHWLIFDIHFPFILDGEKVS